MPGIVLCLALLAHAWPALHPPSPSPLLIVCQVLETRVLFSEINFRFVLPFCGSTKRVGPFVLPQKGRTVPSLFLFFPLRRFSVARAGMEPPTGSIFGDLFSSGFGYGGGVGQGRFQNFR